MNNEGISNIRLISRPINPTYTPFYALQRNLTHPINLNLVITVIFCLGLQHSEDIRADIPLFRNVRLRLCDRVHIVIPEDLYRDEYRVVHIDHVNPLDIHLEVLTDRKHNVLVSVLVIVQDFEVVEKIRELQVVTVQRVEVIRSLVDAVEKSCPHLPDQIYRLAAHLSVNFLA